MSPENGFGEFHSSVINRVFCFPCSRPALSVAPSISSFFVPLFLPPSSASPLAFPLIFVHPLFHFSDNALSR